MPFNRFAFLVIFCTSLLLLSFPAKLILDGSPPLDALSLKALTLGVILAILSRIISPTLFTKSFLIGISAVLLFSSQFDFVGSNYLSNDNFRKNNGIIENWKGSHPDFVQESDTLKKTITTFGNGRGWQYLVTEVDAKRLTGKTATFVVRARTLPPSVVANTNIVISRETSSQVDPITVGREWSTFRISSYIPNTYGSIKFVLGNEIGSQFHIQWADPYVADHGLVTARRIRAAKIYIILLGGLCFLTGLVSGKKLLEIKDSVTIKDVTNIIDKYFNFDAKGRDPAFDGVRGLSILLLFNGHFVGMYYSAFKDTDTIFHSYLFFIFAGNTGAHLFLILSGFLITNSITSKNLSYLKFIGNRYERLFPVIIVTSIPLAMISSSEHSLINIFNNLLFFDLFDQNYLIPAIWLMSYEFYFYYFGGLWVVLSRTFHKMMSWTVLFCLFLPLIIGIVYDYVYMPNDKFQASVFFTFYIGMLLSKIYRDQNILPKIMPWSYWSWVPGVAIIYYNRMSGIFDITPTFSSTEATLAYILLQNNFLLDMGYGLILLSAFHPQGLARKFFSLRPLRILGAISFSILLTHQMYVFMWTKRLFNVFPPNISDVAIHYLIAGTAVLGISIFLFHYLERPYYFKKK